MQGWPTRDGSESSETSSDRDLDEIDAPQDGVEWVDHIVLNALLEEGDSDALPTGDPMD